MFSIKAGGLVARGLRIGRSTNLVIASVTAAVATNATVAMQFTTMVGQILLGSIIFATVGIGIWAVSMDIYSRSSQTVSSMRSIGATAASITSALLVPVLIYSAAGSAIGASLGAGVGILLGNAAGPATAFASIAVILACSAASAAGVYAGVRAAWAR